MSHRADFAVKLPLTVAEVDRVVELIRQIAGDDERAHAREDELHHAVMKAIADGVWRDAPAALCCAALKTKEIEFSRYMA